MIGYGLGLSQRDENGDIVSISSDKALPLLLPGTPITLDVPLGHQFSEKIKTLFVGRQLNSALLFQIPTSIYPDTKKILREGTPLAVRGISNQGEGAVLGFRTTVLRHYSPPNPMVALSIPETMQVRQLRSEPRFELDIPMTIDIDNYSFSGNITDISCSGCGVLCENHHFLEKDKEIQIRINKLNNGKEYLLQGLIRNVREKNDSCILGVYFKESGLISAQNLLQDIILKGISNK